VGLGAAPAVILGAVTGVGGGTLRDVLLGQIPSVLWRGLYAIPALSAAVITVAAVRAGIYGLPAALGAVLACRSVAVEVGFEPTEDLRLHTLSSTALGRSLPSATVPEQRGHAAAVAGERP